MSEPQGNGEGKKMERGNFNKLRNLVGAASFAAISAFGGQKNAEAKSVSPSYPDKPGLPTIVIPQSGISDPGDPTKQEGRKGIDEVANNPEKAIEQTSIIEQMPDGKIRETGQTLSDIGGTDLDYTTAIMNQVKGTGFSWINPDNVSYLIVGKEGKTLKESAASQDSAYFIVNKGAKDSTGGRMVAGGVVIVGRVGPTAGLVTFLPLGKDTADEVNEFATKSNIKLEVPATADNTRYTVYDHNQILVWVGDKPVAISNFVNDPPKTQKLIDSLVSIPPELSDLFSNGFEFVSYDPSSPIITTPDGGQFTVNKDTGKFENFEIKKIDILHNKYTDSAGNVRDIKRLPEGTRGVIKDKKFVMEINDGFSPNFDAVFERWGEDLVINKDGKDVIFKVAVVRIPTGGRLVSAKFVFGEEEGAGVGITVVNKEGNTVTPYGGKSKSYEEFFKLIRPGMQVYISTASKEDYDRDVEAGYYKLDTLDLKVSYDIAKRNAALNKILRDLRNGKSVSAEDLTFVGLIAIPPLE